MCLVIPTSSMLTSRLNMSIVVLGLCLGAAPACSQDLASQREALQMIGDFADRICQTPSTKGEASTVELSGDAKAELNKFLKKVADLGLQGAAKYKHTEYENVLQKDLADVIQKARDCRKDVAKELTDKLVLPADASGSYYSVQLGGQPATVGKAFTADLGFVAAGVSIDIQLAVRLVAGSGRFVVGDPSKPLSLVSPSAREVDLASQQPLTFTIRLESPAVEGKQEREIRLLAPAANGPLRGQQPLILRVSWNALKPSVAVSKDSGAKASGTGKDFSPPYDVCATAPSPGDYVLVPGSVSHSLTGDRACNAWSTCTERSSEKEYCLIFTLQGHDECQRPFANCDASRNSEGHVSATFNLRTSVQTLSGS